MVKKIKDRFGVDYLTHNLQLYSYEDGGYKLWDGTYLVNTFCDLEDAIDCLELTKEEVEKLEKDGELL